MTPLDLGWVVGMFEGEGSISIGTKRNEIAMAMCSTDEDVVRRFHNLVSCGTVVGPHSTNGNKDQFTWRSSTNDSERLLRLFLPLLGNRRAARATEALQARQDYKDLCTQERICPQCNTSFRPSYNLGAFKKVYCSKTCKWNKWNSTRSDRVAA